MVAETPHAERLEQGQRAQKGRPRSRARSLKLYLLAPAVLFLTIVFAYPMIDIVLRGFGRSGTLTVAYYQNVVIHPIYLRVFQITFEIAFMVTIVTLMLGYPLAYILAKASKRLALAIIVCVLLSQFTNILVCTYAWLVILGPEGVLNQLLRLGGLGSLNLLFNRHGVLIGMTYALLPYMVLTLYSVMHSIDGRLMQAARNLGARSLSK